MPHGYPKRDMIEVILRLHQSNINKKEPFINSVIRELSEGEQVEIESQARHGRNTLQMNGMRNVRQTLKMNRTLRDQAESGYSSKTSLLRVATFVNGL